MYLYLCRMSDPAGEEEFYKIGVSQSPASRFNWGKTKVIDSEIPLLDKLNKVFAGEKYVSDHPYETETIHRVKFRYEGEAYLRERDLLADLKTSQYWPNRKFSGQSECFSCDAQALRIIVQYMDAAAAEAEEAEISELEYKVASLGVRETDKIARHLAVLENHWKRQQSIG